MFFFNHVQNQINLYNEIANTNEALMEADSMGGQLGNWLIENKIIEHIFGPNLHVEVFFCFAHSRNQL